MVGELGNNLTSKKQIKINTGDLTKKNETS